MVSTRSLVIVLALCVVLLILAASGTHQRDDKPKPANQSTTMQDCGPLLAHPNTPQDVLNECLRNNR